MIVVIVFLCILNQTKFRLFPWQESTGSKSFKILSDKIQITFHGHFKNKLIIENDELARPYRDDF